GALWCSSPTTAARRTTAPARDLRGPPPPSRSRRRSRALRRSRPTGSFGPARERARETVRDAPTADPVPCGCHRSFSAGALRFVLWLRAALTVRRGGAVEIQRGLGSGLRALFPSAQAGQGESSTAGTPPTDRAL